MPIYRIPAGGGGNAQDAWAQGASALANAFTGTLESEIAAAKAGQDFRVGQARERLLGEQATTETNRRGALDAQAAASWADEAKKNAEAQGLNFDLEVRKKLQSDLAAGLIDENEYAELISEASAVMDPVETAGNLGNINLARHAARPGATQESIDIFSRGAGANFQDTRSGNIMADQADARTLQQEQIAAREQAALDRQHDLAKIGATPVTLGENAVAVIPRTGETLSGNRSVAVNEQILGPDNEVVATGPQFVEEAPDAPEIQIVDEGADQVTYQRATPGDPRANEFGWIEIGRGPRTTDAGTLETPLGAAKAEDFKADIGSVLENGRGAMDRVNAVDQTLAYLKSGVVPTGFWTELTMPVRSALAGLGLDEETMGKIEFVTSQLGDRVMARIQETKGAVSEKEMEYFRLISASIGKTPGGNILLLEKERRVHERAANMRNFALSLPDDMSSAEASRALEEWREQHPLFTEEEIQQIETAQANPDLGSIAAPQQPGAGTDLATEDLDRY
jgi:hypothetical protein